MGSTNCPRVRSELAFAVGLSTVPWMRDKGLPFATFVLQSFAIDMSGQEVGVYAGGDLLDCAR